MRRSLWKAAMILWLLLPAAVLAFWVRSHRHFRDHIEWSSAMATNRVQQTFVMESRPGYLIILWQRVIAEPSDSYWPLPPPQTQTRGFAWSFEQLDRSAERVLERIHRDDTPARYGAGYHREDVPLRESIGVQHAYGNSGLLGRQSTRSVSLSYWLLTLLLCLPAIPLAIQHRKTRRRQKQGLCLQCGYDMRATPQRCPECGAIPNEAEEVVA